MDRNGLSSGDVLLKVDVEGAELDVLRGAKKTLERTKVLVLEICWGVPFTAKCFGLRRGVAVYEREKVYFI
jgi:hypothetical protein